MGKVTLQGYSCDRCGHEWIPRIKIEEEPTICPKCKSPYWNKPRRIDLARDANKPADVFDKVKRIAERKQRTR